MTRDEVAAWLKVAPRQIDRLRIPCLDLGEKTKRNLVKDVAAWLSRHGVLANQQVPDECGHAAEQLNRIASELNAGVVVARWTT